MKRINLLPKTQQQELVLLFLSQKILLFWIWIVITLVIFLILTLAGKSYLSRQLADVSHQVETKKAVLKSSDNELLKQQVGNLNNQILAIKNINAQHYQWAAALIELGNLFAQDLSMDLITVDRATGKVDVKGTAATRESVLKFWSDIHKSTYFKNINFPLSNLNRATNDSFTFSFYLNPEQIKQ
jgi:uncharacterized membrane protein